MSEGGFSVVRRRRHPKEYPRADFEAVVRPFMDEHSQIHGLWKTLRRPEIIQAISTMGYVPWMVRRKEDDVSLVLGVDCLFFDMGNRYGDVLVLKKK